MATYISSLPEELRLLAIQRRLEQSPSSNDDILGSAFMWSYTREGDEFWDDIDYTYDETREGNIYEQDDQIIK